VRRIGAQPGADDALRRFLLDAVDVVRLEAGLSAVPMDRLLPVVKLTRLPVRLEIRCPDDGLSMYMHCTADVRRWPAELIGFWDHALAVQRGANQSQVLSSTGS
jgi:hypothetical protein